MNLKLLELSLVVLPLLACQTEKPQAKIIEINKKIPLIDWPDSSYVMKLDSILALEPIKKTDKNKPNIAMNAFKAPNFILPSSVTGKQEKKSNKSFQKAPSNIKVIQNNTQESFANKFTEALTKLQSDPSNSNLYKIVETKDGEDLFDLLRRIYGNGAQNLPRFYVLSALQSVNAGVSLEHLNASDKVRVPRI